MTELVVVTHTADQRAEGLAELFVAGRLSPETRRAYRNHLRRWLTWCAGARVDPFDARFAHVGDWLRYRHEVGDSDSTRAARLSAVSSWYRWLLREEIVIRNPAALLPQERPQPNPEHTPALSPTQAETLLAAADTDSLRASALVALMLYTGVRIGELLRADVSDLGQDTGVQVLRIMAKGRKRRQLPLIPAVWARVTRYLDSRPSDRLPARAGEVAAGRPLLVTRTGRRMVANEARRILLRCARKAGLPAEVVDTLTPHSTRATYATTNLAAGTPLRDVQYALGHASPATTELYDRSNLSLDRHPSTRLAAVIRPPDLAELQQDTPSPLS